MYCLIKYQSNFYIVVTIVVLVYVSLCLIEIISVVCIQYSVYSGVNNAELRNLAIDSEPIVWPLMSSRDFWLLMPSRDFGY